MEDEKQWDIKRIAIGVAVVASLAVAGYAMKGYFLDKFHKQEVRKQEDGLGSIAGAETQETTQDPDVEILSKKDLEKKIDTIKNNISSLTPEDIVKQEPVKKILHDVDSLKASTEAQVVNGAKSTVCEQAKRIFCSQ